MLCKFLTRCMLVVTVVAMMCPSANADIIPDLGIPDSAYFGAPDFRMISCTEVVVTLPVYLFSDYFSMLNVFTFDWIGEVDCDTVHIFETGEPISFYTSLNIQNNLKKVVGGALAEPGNLCPTDGTELFLELVFLTSPGDSFSIAADLANFSLRNPIEAWFPRYTNMASTIYVPSSFVLQPGDTDCSGVVTISDVVYLINYIFLGGIPPHDLNAADVDSSCFVTISDAVHLINYIFSGGNPPAPGCIN